MTLSPSTNQPTEATEDFLHTESEPNWDDIVHASRTPAPLTYRPSSNPTSGPTTPSEPNWDDVVHAFATSAPRSSPTHRPTTRNPTEEPSAINNPPPRLPLSTATSSRSVPAPSQELMAKIGTILAAASDGLTNDVLLTIDLATKEESPTQFYQYGGFVNALGVLSKGDMGSTYFYLGDTTSNGVDHGLVNIALFLAQAAVETIKFDICDEISWEKDVFGRYPISNSCGQGRYAGLSLASYQDSNPCAEDEAFMACPVDPTTVTVATTRGIFNGAPPPLECHPRTPTEVFTGAWDPSLFSEDGQTLGRIDPSSIPSANSFGRKDVEGCCWWGRGAFPRGSSGTCMIGKLNYYLGKQAHDQGRSSRYKEIDFCEDPGAICRDYSKNKETNAEIRWLMGMMYWINTVQTYSQGGWSYLEKLKQFTDEGRIDVNFLEQVSRIVTRGCHDQSSCGYAVSSDERLAKFNKILHYFAFDGVELVVPFPSKRPTFLPTAKPANPTILPTGKPTNPPTVSPTAKPTNRRTFLPTAKPTHLPMVFSTIEVMNPTQIPTTTETKMPMQIQSTTHPTFRAAKNTGTSSPISQPHILPSTEIPSLVSQENYELTTAELASRLSRANNYCAPNEEEVNTKCATPSLRTCNFGDPPCTLGTGCYKNVICKIAWSEIELAQPPESDISGVKIQTLKESATESISHLRALVSCNGRCLRPLSASECMAGGVITFLPNCLSVAVGEMCELGVNECDVGANAHISECPQGRKILVRVFVEQCSLSTTEPPAIHVSYHSSPPSNHVLSSLKPTSLNAIGGKDEESSGLPSRKDDDFLGAWWTRSNTNASTRTYRVPMFLLLYCTVALS